MPQINFTINAQFDSDDVLNYAMFRGWTATNPMTKEDFICNLFKKQIVDSIATFVKRNQLTPVTNTYNQTIATISTAVEANVASSITVTSQEVTPP